MLVYTQATWRRSFCCSFWNRIYMCILKGIILNRFLYRAQWKRSDFDKSFFLWIERYSHISTMSNIRTVIQRTFVQKYKVKRQNNSNKIRCSILQRTKLTFFWFSYIEGNTKKKASEYRYFDARISTIYSFFHLARAPSFRPWPIYSPRSLNRK